MKRIVSNSFVAFLLMLLIGCGFHLRGAIDYSDSLKSIYVEGISLQRGIGLYLKRGLKSNGIEVLDTYQKGSAVLKVTETKHDRRVLSVGSSAKISEYELYSSISFSLTDSHGEILAGSQQVQAHRDFQFNENQVLARESEEASLRQHLNKELVQGVLRRLSAIK